MVEDIIVLISIGPLAYWRNRKTIANRPLWVKRIIWLTTGTERYIALRAWLRFASGMYPEVCYMADESVIGAFWWCFTPEGPEFWERISETIE